MDYYIISPLLFLLRIVEVSSQFTLSSVISGIKFSIKKFIWGTLLFTISFEVFKPFIPQYLTSVVSTFLAISTFIFVFKINYKKAILSYLITIITVGIIDCAVCLIIIKICNLSTFSEVSSSEFLMTIGRIAIALVMFLVSSMFYIFKNKKKIISTENIKTSTSLITFIITFLLLFPNFAMILYYHDNKALPFSIITINIIAIIAMFFVSLYNTQRGIKLIQAEEELLTERTYNKTLQNLVDGLRTFKHDYNNTLQTMYGYILTNNFDELKNFFAQILDESRAITALDKLNPELFRNPSLFGLVTAKFEYARCSDVTLNFEIYADLDNLDIKTYDFTRTLGIFLDNAIEASAGSEKKIVNFYVVERSGKVTIEISNSFSDTGLKVEDINKKGMSSKGENRGLGLYKVNEIIKKYPKIIHETKISNGMFLQKLVIEKQRVIVK